jgi:Zn-dependent membrane protease YugP
MTTTVYLLLAVVPLGLGLLARFWVSSTFADVDELPAESGATGLDAAERLLTGRCPGVTVESVEGELTDHYDPQAHVIRLSEGVARSSSVAALAVVAHEVGHALQHQEGELAFRVQRALVPVASLCSWGWIGAFTAGLVLESAGYVVLALLLFAVVAAFYVATFPVELGASRTALVLLGTEGLVGPGQIPEARRVLRAAACTYLIAMVAALLQLARIALEILLSDDE